MIDVYPKPERKCTQCHSLESTGTVLAWYWNDDYQPVLLCQTCAMNMAFKTMSVVPKEDSDDS